MTDNIRKIELLSPARNKECGMEAILHGADAVYIGAPHHGARAAAGNSIEDIRELAEFAHIYNAKVYVTVNTIIYDSELEDTRKMIYDLYYAGVDALIVQDMAILEMDLPPIALHASTQTDNRTADKVRRLYESGFSQVVLARELSLEEIREIHNNVPVPLEVFIHGALCVSYSGQCYISQACFGRSSNRGECAQFCRLPLTLTDADGKIIAKDKHLLSLKDMNRSEYLEQLLDAGATSLKIEGRLKDVAYVKNVTAYYRQKLDSIFERRKEYGRASSGTTDIKFKPELSRSFNRRFTDYFLNGRKKDIASFDTPKSLGEKIGKVKDIRNNSFSIDTQTKLNNGDGLCFVNAKGEMQGFRINKTENNNVFPLEMPALRKGDIIYRNYDISFDRELSRKTSERRISLNISLTENRFGFTLSATDEDGNKVSLAIDCPKETANNSQRENIIRQLSKLGNTPFKAETVEIDMDTEYFIPSSILSDYRRRLAERMISARKIRYSTDKRIYRQPPILGTAETDYTDNIANRLSAQFYSKAGVQTIKPAYEIKPQEHATVMFCKHCIKNSLGYCTKENKKLPFREPLTLTAGNGKKFKLKFDCRKCEMYLIDDN